MKKTLTASMLLLALTASSQVKTAIHEFNQAGPFAVSQPFQADTVNVSGKKFDVEAMLNAINVDVKPTQHFAGEIIPSLKGQKSVGVLSFYLNNSNFLKGKVVVKGPKNYRLFVDGVGAGQDLKLAPEHHTIAIKYLAEPSDTDSISVCIEADKQVVTTLDKRHPYMVHDLTDGRRVRDVSLSADGAFAVVTYQTTSRGGESRWNYELLEVKTLKLKSRLAGGVKWMPKSCAYIEEAYEGGKRTLYRVDPLTGERTCWAVNVPKGGYTISPSEDYLIITVEEDGPKEDADVFEIVEMDDRQPGWRNRSYLTKYDLATGMSQRIILSPKDAYLEDISQDGKKLLIGISYSRLSKRPTEVQDAYIVDAQTLKVDTLFKCYGFVGGGSFSPDASKILFTGTPEAFGRIGCQLPLNVTPSMTETELFLYDIATSKVTPLTKDFDPSVQNAVWSMADEQIYISAEDRDYVNLFAIDSKTFNINKLPVNGDYAYRWTLASNAPVLAYVSYKTLEPASAYVANLKSLNVKRNTLLSQIVFDGNEALGDASVGTCQDWNFTNSRGDTVYGRLYLPENFDVSKKYPMIVYYYGGCSPVSRYFESPYAPQYWNSLGYVAYILQPSGATGFGQDWASRHVNTAGKGPAEDIIEGTKKICEAHPFIDKSKIGCMGASYGGFMTQYLQTQTDIFAAAVSHAGISNHTSYWGEGYWGYNYSEVSMANSYPWSHRELYVDQSPLFNADKIHTPLLLLHGDADTNVPLIESLQMFTALKLLGREVALVEVKGENHHILDYKKREKWLATQMAWFQRWLKDDPTWWNELYPQKHL